MKKRSRRNRDLEEEEEGRRSRGGRSNGRRKRKEKQKEVPKPVGFKNCKIPEIKPKSDNQAAYLESIDQYPMTFCVGPAGTGKTFLACYTAAKKLVKGEIVRIVLTRPAVEAGESLGFLPGRLEDKLDPYLRPLYDCLNDMIGFERTKQLVKDRVIEVVPLAYMRGRTLNKAFVILDEAQNVTRVQMKMFLTRMGNNSTFVINGDITQSDLHDKADCGLIEVHRRLRNVEGVNWITFEKTDVVRNVVVQRIVEAYGED